MRLDPGVIDFKRLFKLRLVVARHGEMDAARWWNTQGMLGRRGALVLKRGFPIDSPLRSGADRLRGGEDALP